jgi:hypothetical protein
MTSTIAIYTTPPQRERKALEEIRRNGDRAYLPRVPKQAGARPSPIAPGYVFATGKPSEAVYVKRKVGMVTKDGVRDLMLTGRVRRRPRAENPFKAGDLVTIAKGHLAEVKAKVTEVRARTCIIAFDLLGKTHQQAMPYAQLRPG